MQCIATFSGNIVGGFISLSPQPVHSFDNVFRRGAISLYISDYFEKPGSSLSLKTCAFCDRSSKSLGKLPRLYQGGVGVIAKISLCVSSEFGQGRIECG